MSRLHLVSLPLDLRGFRQWMARRGLGVDEGRALHHLFGETFGKGALQPFRLMVAPGAGRGTGSPARAGIDPTAPARKSRCPRLPRTCGDRPKDAISAFGGPAAPLHVRG